MECSHGESESGCGSDLASICCRRRWSVYWMLIVCSLGVMAARILTLGDASSGELPFFSANDRSRWCTVRALGDEGVYSIDRVLGLANGRRWDTIDKVVHRGRDGRFHAYSSKPALWPTLWAAEYWALKALTGLNFTDHPVWVMRLLLVVNHGGLWLLFLFSLAQVVESIPVRDGIRYYVLLAAAFGTYLSPFGMVFNNHFPAAVLVMVSLMGGVRIWNRPDSSRWWYALVGLASALAAANELPALSWVAVAGGLMAWRSASRTLVGFVPPALLVGGCFFLTNWAAHGTWSPPYAHRGDGALIATVEGDWEARLDRGRLPLPLRDAAESVLGAPVVKVERAAWPSATREPVARWIVRDLAGDALSIVRVRDRYELREWDNWYDYPGSYWLTTNRKKSEVDRGQADVGLYGFHLLLGHHGFFSLTPLWIMGLAGLWVLVFDGRWNLRWWGVVGILLSLVVVGFYLTRPEMDRNYGGMTSGPRWLFWLIPFYLVGLVPIVDGLGRFRWGYWLCLVVLGLSVLSAWYAMDNPWVHPWLYEVWSWTGLPG